MSTFATFWAVVAALNSVILLGSILPASAYRSLSFEDDIDSNEYFTSFAERTFENTNFVYYISCERFTEPKKCIVHRVQDNFSGGSLKEHKCNVTWQPESGVSIRYVEFSIVPIDKDRAIICWLEEPRSIELIRKDNLRFSIINFSNCKVKTTKLPEGISIDKNYAYYAHSPSYSKLVNGIYIKEKEDLDVILFNSMGINKYSINAEGIVSKVDTWFTYPINFWSSQAKFMFPLLEDKGYLLMEMRKEAKNFIGVTTALIQPNGQKRNLTQHVNLTLRELPKLTLDNGLIGLCIMKNTTLKCTQFRPDDKEINWFSVSSIVDPFSIKSIYNLPKGEGFLIFAVADIGDKNFTENDKQLVKIGLDGKVKQYVNVPDMRCRGEVLYERIFKDSQGNYCVSIACTKKVYSEWYQFIMKFQSKCFEP